MKSRHIACLAAAVCSLIAATAVAIVPMADELKLAEEWAVRTLDGDMKELPFTFSYEGKDFRTGGWTKTRTDTGYVFREPSGTIEAILEIRKYPGFPALSWLLRFRNVAAVKSGVISNVHNFDLYVPSVSKRKHHLVHHAAGAMQSLDDYQQFTTPVTWEWWIRPHSHRLHIGFHGASKFLFSGVASLMPDDFGKAASSIGYISVCWLLLYFLHRKRIYLKV